MLTVKYGAGNARDACQAVPAVYNFDVESI